MTQEEKNEQVEQTDNPTQQEASPAEDAESTDESQDASQEADSTDEEATEPQQVDYKAELETERKRREKAESAAQRYREQVEGKSQSSEETSQKFVDEYGESSLTKDDVERMLDERMMQQQLQQSMRLAQDEASSLAGSPEEAEAILYHYENSIRPTGDVRADIEVAHAIANRTRINGIIRERQRSKLSETTKAQPQGSGQKKPQKKEQQPLSDADRRFLEKNNLVLGKNVRINEQGQYERIPEA